MAAIHVPHHARQSAPRWPSRSPAPGRTASSSTASPTSPAWWPATPTASWSHGDEYEQAKAIFAKIKDLIEAAGGAMADVVKVTIFVTDIRNREQVWQRAPRVLHRQLPGQHAGARSRRWPTPASRSRSRPSPTSAPAHADEARRPRPHFRSASEAGPGPGVIRVGHCFEPNGTAGGRNGFMPRLAVSAMMAARASPPISS